MLRSDKIYEYYVLLKLYNYIISKEYSLQLSITYSCKNPGFYSGYTNHYGLTALNTFLFKNIKTSTELTLYYEPIMWEKINLGCFGICLILLTMERTGALIQGVTTILTM